VPHNVVIQELEGTVEDPAGVGETFVATDVINGVEDDFYEDDTLTWDDLPEQWYFFCAIHPNMNGVGEVVSEG
jgi:plastocyanin